MSAPAPPVPGDARGGEVRTIALAVHRHRADAVAVAEAVIAWAARSGIRVVDVDGTDDPGRAAAETPDLVVSIGGDGTILRAVRALGGRAVPIIGANLGSLGYLADVEADSVLDALAAWTSPSVDVRCSVEDRMLLDVVVRDAGGTESRSLALNEVVLEKRDAGHTVHLSVEIDSAPFTTYAADGLIVATPTGSTAYSLSARGPVVSPRLRALLVTPVSPHMLFDRSMVLDPRETVRVEVLDYRAVTVSVDGLPMHTLEPGGVVTVSASEKVARFVRFGGGRFHGVLKSKFGLADR